MTMYARLSLALVVALLAAALGCSSTRVHYTAENALTFAFSRTIRKKTIPWDSLIVVRTKDGLDLVLNPYEPVSGGDDKLVIGVEDRSRGIKFYEEETELVDAKGSVHMAVTELVDPGEEYTIACPETNPDLRAAVGKEFRCKVRLLYSELDPEEDGGYTLRFFYRPEKAKERTPDESRLKRQTAKY
jgi:hypothetical protein